jgi:hypothetical protein
MEELKKDFKPTTNWMREKYNEMNDELFNGELGYCDFKIFTSGRGSQGRTLGYFQMRRENLRVDRYNRRMLIDNYWKREYINKNNFVDICLPLIALNGNYYGTEYGFLSTLVHEMCHYYTYMYGFAPTRGHGREFYDIGERVCLRSGGKFNIQRLATAEDMQHLELNDEMKAKAEKRITNKKSSLFAVFDYRKDGEVHLTTTNNKPLIDFICSSSKSEKVVISNDSKLIDLLFEKGYKKNFRTWRYWNVSDASWLNILDDVEKKVITFSNENIKRTTDEIINEVINNFINKNDEDRFIDIDPNMNLGLVSPLEL